MWLIPGRTKVKIEIFKGIGLLDIIVAMVGILITTLVLLSGLPFRYVGALIVVTLFVFLLLKIDEEPNYLFIFHLLQHTTAKKHYTGADFESLKEGRDDKENTVKRLSAFTDIRDNVIVYGDDYYGIAFEIPAVEFRFFSESKRNNSIVNGIGRVLRNISPDYCANLVKLDRPIHYSHYISLEYDKLDELKKAYENAELREEELKARVEVIYDRIRELEYLENTGKVYVPFYYLVVFEKDRRQLEMQASEILDDLEQASLSPKRLDDRELALFLKYSNDTNVNEEELAELDPSRYAEWAMPKNLDVRMKNMDLNGTVTTVRRVVSYPSTVPSGWLASVMSVPGTKVVLKCRPMDREKAVRSIDRSLNELRSRAQSTSVDSQLMDIETHIATLSELLETLQGENESLIQTNIYVTAYDLTLTEKYHEEAKERNDLPRVNNFGKMIRRVYREQGFRMSNLEFQQTEGFIASQVSAYDPFQSEGRGIPSNTVSACYPWVFAHVSDEKGIKLGTSDGVPVMLDFFRRDNERVNSNMVIVGKSGSGKSYATKSLLTNLAADDSKIFILDPENEYTELAANLHGKFINVGNAQYGRMNPFQIITALDDDEEGGEGNVSGSYATHLQFLEEFFRQILPDCEKDALEYLNSIIDRMYVNMGISQETDLSKLKPSDFPIFDNLYDAILEEFQKTDNQYIRTMLRTLMNYIQKFATGGRNANIWNGPSTITTEEKFTVFNFQSLLSNRNNTIANAQMLLVLKYIDNEIIKNREYNLKNNAKRKIVVVVDEAHVFIDEKFPIALDFMYQLAKRIRKYNGMQIVITQNIKDFVGTEELARKSTAIINACQYSFIFSLAPNDMDDLCKLYEKAGGINESEQEQIVSAQRGQVFTVLGPDSRSSFKVEVPENVVSMFENPDFASRYFEGIGGAENWENFIGNSREKHDNNISTRNIEAFIEEQEELRSGFVSVEIMEEEPEEPEEPGEEPVEPENEPVRETEPVYNAQPETIPQPDYAALAAAIAANRPDTSRTEERLTELVEKLSNDNIELRLQEKIEEEVRNRVNEALAGMKLSPSAADFEEEEGLEPEAPVREEPSLSSGSSALGNIFAAASDDGEKDDDDFDDDDFDFDDDNAEDDEDDDFMKMFSEGVGLLNNISGIEMMEIYDETVSDISLEDLDKYILNVVVNGGNESEDQTVS